MAEKTAGNKAPSTVASVFYAASVKGARIARDRQKLAADPLAGVAAADAFAPARVQPPDDFAARQRRQTLLLHQLLSEEGTASVAALDEIDICYPLDFCWSPRAQLKAIHFLRELPPTSKSRASTCSTRAGTSLSWFDSVSPEPSKMARPGTSLSQISEHSSRPHSRQRALKSPDRARSVEPELSGRSATLFERPKRVTPVVSDPSEREKMVPIRSDPRAVTALWRASDKVETAHIDGLTEEDRQLMEAMSAELRASPEPLEAATCKPLEPAQAV